MKNTPIKKLISAKRSAVPAAKTPINRSVNIKLSEVVLPEISPAQIRSLVHDWVPYGKKNDFPDYLILAAKKCTEHSSLLATRQDLISGEGANFGTSKDKAEATGKQFEIINSDGETINDILNQVKVDLAVLETMALQVVWSKDKKTITDVFYQDSSKVRPSRVLNDRNQPKGYWYCANWKEYLIYPPVYFDRFDISQPGGTQLYFYHKSALGQPFIPDVSYVSALNYVELSYEMSKYALNYVLNGFFVAGIFNVKANNEEELLQADANIQKTFSGTDNAGRVMVFANNEGDGVSFTPLANTDNTPMMEALNDLISNKVCTSHRANPIIAGIQTGGSNLGSDGKLFSTAMQTYYNLVIRDLQKPFLTFWKLYFKVHQVDATLDISSSALLQTEMPEALQAEIKPEILVAQWGYKPEDLISHNPVPTIPAPTASPVADAVPTIADIPKNPFNK